MLDMYYTISMYYLVPSSMEHGNQHYHTSTVLVPGTRIASIACTPEPPECITCTFHERELQHPKNVSSLPLQQAAQLHRTNHKK